MKNVIIIPCYNEAQRLQLSAFQSFINTESKYTLCFVNDGSSDDTLDILQRFQAGQEDRVKVFDMPQNGGKAEAVRSGILHMIETEEVRTIGFIDADLSTSFKEYMRLVDHIDLSAGGVKMVFGSRNMSEESDVKRTPFRALMSSSVGMMIKAIHTLPIHDTQCGAKVLTTELAAYCFKRSFITRWLFDVELFIRIKDLYGKRTMDKIKEVSLQKWVHVDGSKITISDSLRIPMQLSRIVAAYQFRPVLQSAQLQMQSVTSRFAQALAFLF